MVICNLIHTELSIIELVFELALAERLNSKSDLANHRVSIIFLINKKIRLCIGHMQSTPYAMHQHATYANSLILYILLLIKAQA
jgi:hypothetical protein